MQCCTSPGRASNVWVQHISALSLILLFEKLLHWTLTSHITALPLDLSCRMMSGLRSSGDMLCSTNTSTPSLGIAFTSLSKIFPCLSLIKPAFGVQAFSTCPRVSGCILGAWTCQLSWLPSLQEEVQPSLDGKSVCWERSVFSLWDSVIGGLVLVDQVEWAALVRTLQVKFQAVLLSHFHHIPFKKKKKVFLIRRDVSFTGTKF